MTWRISHPIREILQKGSEFGGITLEEWFNRAVEFGIQRHILEKASSNIELAWFMDQDFITKTKMLGERIQALGVIQRANHFL